MARQKTGRMCTAEEVAHLCVYLASDEVSIRPLYPLLFHDIILRHTAWIFIRVSTHVINAFKFKNNQKKKKFFLQSAYVTGTEAIIDGGWRL